MTTFDLLMVLVTVCGIAMLAGLMYLLSRGKIDFATAGNALTITILDKFTLTTGYPVLGLFLIGPALIAGTLWVARPTPATAVPADVFNSVEIKGQLHPPDASPVNVFFRTLHWDVSTSREGLLLARLFPEFGRVVIIVAAPNYTPGVFQRTFEPHQLKSGVVDLGTVELGELTRRTPDDHPERVEPTREPLAPLGDAKSF